MSSQAQPRKRTSSNGPAIDALVNSKSRQGRRREDPPHPPSLKEANQESRSSAAPAWAACEAVQPENLARRLACGRTRGARLLLEQTRLFHFDGADDLPVKSDSPQPCRGLQADYQGMRVYILDTYKRRGKLQADVAPIRAGRAADMFVLGPNLNARGCELTNLGSSFLLSIGARGRPELRRCSPDAEPRSTQVGPAVAKSLGMPPCAGERIAVPEHGKPVVPEGALQHVRETRSRGYAHSTVPLPRRLGPHFMHDLPLPVQFDARPHRCTQCMNHKRTTGTKCRNRKKTTDDEDMPLVEWCKDSDEDLPLVEWCQDSDDDLPLVVCCKGERHLGGQEIGQVASKNYWAVSDDDIRREFPGAVCCRIDQKKKGGGLDDTPISL